MTITVHADLEQGTDEWRQARLGIVTASVVGQLVTPTLKVASNQTSRAIVRELVAERITGHAGDSFVSFDMARGWDDEPRARDIYSQHFAPVQEVGFITRDDWGFRIGYSPDGLVGDDGLIEIKSRLAKHHLATVLDGEVPPEYMAQIQTGLLVSDRKWCDYLSYCGGMPLYRIRVHPDPDWQAAIVAAVEAFEFAATAMTVMYYERVAGLPMTERIDYDQEIEI